MQGESSSGAHFLLDDMVARLPHLRFLNSWPPGGLRIVVVVGWLVGSDNLCRAPLRGQITSQEQPNAQLAAEANHLASPLRRLRRIDVRLRPAEMPRPSEQSVDERLPHDRSARDSELLL